MLENESWIRLSVFGLVFFLLALWEVKSPRRKLKNPKLRRWPVNIGLIIISTLLIKFLFLGGAIVIADTVEKKEWGLLFYYFKDLPFWAHVIIAFILLDLSIYFQHVMFHTLPLLWRFHRVHHADTDCDVTTGIRFHPIEMLLSILIKFMTIVAIGAPVIAVLIFELVLNATSMFTHSNVRLPGKMDPLVRWLFVTPDMHRVHHSSIRHETNSNFGFNFSFWDRLFGTYIKQPELGHDNMDIGLKKFKQAKWGSLRWLLYMPFITEVPNYLIGTKRSNETTSSEEETDESDIKR